jgi:hypothetical protein
MQNRLLPANAEDMLDTGADLDPDLVRIHRGLAPPALVAELVATLGEMIAVQVGEHPAIEPDLDALVDRLRARDRARLGAVYDAFRETLAFRRFVTDPALTQAAAKMTGARRLHSPFQHAVFRMDLVGEAWRGFGWHQDFPYNVMSGSYVTAWAPLTPSGAHNGSIDIAPAVSNRIHPVEIRYKRDADGRRLPTRDAFISERRQAGFEAHAVKLELEPGDVVLFHNRLVHRSGFNPGPRHRYSIQVRFGDLLAREVTTRGWGNRRADGFETFKALHPDLIEHEEA